MATLTRSRIIAQDVSDSVLTSSIPKPFTSIEREHIRQEELLDELANEPGMLSETDIFQEATSNVPGSSLLSTETNANDVLHDVMPSIAFVQKSCLMTLNNLLSVPKKWHPIVPDRRHSMPSAPPSSSVPQIDAVQSSSALQTLVLNLRTRGEEGLMVELPSAQNDTELIRELERRIETLAPSLAPTDANLAGALVSLLAHFNRLSVIQSNTVTSRGDQPISMSHSPTEPLGTADLFDTLERQLSDLQVERMSRSNSAQSGSNQSPVLAVETALLWTRIDEELESVLLLCKERTEGLPRFSSDSATEHLPPQYDPADYELDHPPEYDAETRSHTSTSFDDSKSRYQTQSTANLGAHGEKMRLDLEAVTMAIDRLYLVAPQLHNQRVELKSSKLAQMEQARRSGQHAKGKDKERDVKELENIIGLLDKASDRKMADQAVILEGGMKTRLEKARQRDRQKRDAFVEQLVQHSDAGRFHAQDAVLQHPKAKDPEALLTLPEFIRESMSEPTRVADPEAILTLPEFMKEPVPDHVVHSPSLTRLKSQKKLRSRSMSAPPLSWLRPSSSRSSISGEYKSRRSPKATSRPGSSKGQEPMPSVALDVHYVAENHENLQHVLVFLTVSGVTPGIDVEAEVIPSHSGSKEGDRLIVKSGPNISSPLCLPARTSPGKKEVRVQGTHYEIKLTTSPSTTGFTQEYDSASLLDASQLSASNPTSFICASCSLPLVHSSRIDRYRDLPSEHWEELVDAWMCHTDQTLHEHIVKHGRGFWPEEGQALVGGSYILFEESSVVKNNLWPAEQAKRGEDWRLARCICGAVTGRCQDHQFADNTPATVYRLAKYAIRPVSPTAEPSRVPLSAFIVEDMAEFVHAHATYRFVILDEEEEHPRMLIWLFKPNIRLSYTTPAQYALPKSGSIHAAKVLYKLLKSSTDSSDLKTVLSKYPGFPQAEFLFYPLDICRRLASLLKESNTSYPEGMRTMTGLEVGWLHRA